MNGLGFPIVGPMAKDTSALPLGDRVVVGQQAYYTLPEREEYSFGPSQHPDLFRTGDHISDSILVGALWYGATIKEMADRGLIGPSLRSGTRTWRWTRDGMAWLAAKSGDPMQEMPGLDVALFPFGMSEEDQEFFDYAWEHWKGDVSQRLEDVTVGGVGLADDARLATWAAIAAAGYFGLKALRVLR